MAQNDTSRTALCEDDTIKLAKMGEELDAAAEYINQLQDQIKSLESSPAVTAENPETAKKLDEARGLVEKLKAELVDANETIILLDMEKKDVEEKLAAPQAAESVVDETERADRAALMQVVYQLDRDNPGMSLQDALAYIAGAFAGQADLPVLDPVASTEFVEAFEDHGDTVVDQDFAQWSPPVFDTIPAEVHDDPAEHLAPEAWASPASFEESEETEEPEELPPLPAPVSAAGIANPEKNPGRPLPEGPNDLDWDPSAFVPPKDEAEELNRLLEQFENKNDNEVYGIKAYAQEHPELFEKP